MKMRRGVSDEGLKRLAGRVRAQEGSPQRNNAYLSTDDSIVTILYDSQQAIDLFGDDHLEYYGVSLPEDLIRRYKAAVAEFDEVQKELSNYRRN